MWPLPSALLLSRYGPFAGPVALPLRPLTLLFGANGTGKSALVRLPALLARASAERFTGLAWRGTPGDESFEVGLRWPDEEIAEVRYQLDGGGYGQIPWLKGLTLRDAQGPRWEGAALRAGQPLAPGPGHAPGEVACHGLLPAVAPPHPAAALAARLQDLQARVQFLSTVARLWEFVPHAAPPVDALRPDGANAAHFLAQRPALREEVARFYARLSPSLDLVFSEGCGYLLPTDKGPHACGHRLELRRRACSERPVDLGDRGAGLCQVLPVLAGAAHAAHTSGGGLLAAERVEGNLHPNAQRVLADFFCDLAARPVPPTLVLETHSRVLLLSVQLAVASGRLPRERVALAWLGQDKSGESHLTAVDLDERGQLGAGWPRTAFTTDLRLAQTLLQMQWERDKTDAD